MATLGIPQNTIAVLQKYHFNFQKKFGQNFLIDTHVLERIIEAAGITKDDFVLEIGPGIGTMTQYLCENAREVTAVEIDQNLIPILADTLSAYDNVTVINEDILKLDIVKLAEEKNAGKPIKVVANLPYYITTPIIMGLFESHVPIDSITIMVQKEVADRMQVGPGTKDYGALSLAVQYYAKPEIVANVPPNCFIPRPNVGSAVIRLDRYAEPPVQTADEQFMFSVIRASFNQRRKTLVNGLSNAPGLNVSKEKIKEVLARMELSETVRGETLTLEQFAQKATVSFMRRIPKVREYLETDLQAAYDGDPAARSKDEIVFSYPGLYAITVYRLAHELFLLGVPLIPRMMTEQAHSKTGIDIHPGATIGKYFFIDHGTGIVIGETTIIGCHVKLYQGVTLGALSTKGGQKLRDVRRHPTIGDNVTIYSGASILGGETVIEEGVVIGGNSFITQSIKKGTKVSVRNQELIYHSGDESLHHKEQDESWFYII